MKFINTLLIWLKNIMSKIGRGNPFPLDVPVISIAPVTVTILQGQTLSVTINRAASNYISTCLVYAVPITADATDYTFANGTLVTFAAGDTTKTINIPIVTDPLPDSDETFIVQIANPTFATIGNNKCLVTITGTVSVSATVIAISSPSVIEGGNLVFNINLSGVSSGQSFAYSLGGTAVSPTDYAAPLTFSNGVTINGSNVVVPNGITSFTASTLTVDNTVVNPTKTITLTIGGITGSGNILDNDAVLTSLAVFETPYNMLTAAQQTATSAAGSGGYPAFAVSRDSINQATYAVYSSSTANGTYTKILDNQPYTPSGRLSGSIGYDHRTIAIEDEKDFPTVITGSTIGLIADTAGQQEHCLLTSYNTTVINGLTAKTLDNVGIAAMDSVPIAVGLNNTARMYVLTNYGIDTAIKADGTVIYYKIVPKDNFGNELSLSLVTPISLTITSRASKPLPPKNIGFAVTLGNDYVNFPPPSDNFSGYSVYFKASPSSKVGGPYTYDAPASAYDAGVTVKVAVEGLNGAVTPVRIMDLDTSTGLLTYTQELRAADGARYSTKYTIYSQKDGVNSTPFTYEIQQNVAYINVMSSITVAKVAATVEATLVTDASFGGQFGTGAETTIAFCSVLGTLVTGGKVDTSTITCTAGVEIIEYVGDSNSFYIQIPRSVPTFKIIIPYTTAGATGLALEVRVGKIDDYKSAIQTI